MIRLMNVPMWRVALVFSLGAVGACGGDGGNGSGGGGAPADAPRPAQKPSAPAGLEAVDGASVAAFVDSMLDGWEACVDFCIGYNMECLEDDDYDYGDSGEEGGSDDGEPSWDMNFLNNCWDGCNTMAEYAFTEWLPGGQVTPGAVTCADSFTDFIDCLFDYGECAPATQFIEAELFGDYAPSVCTSEFMAYETACEDL